MAEKDPRKWKTSKILVDKDEFTDVMRKIVNTPPLKREDVEVDEKKPGKIITPKK